MSHQKLAGIFKIPPKTMMIFSYDYRGVLNSHRVPTGETVIREYNKMYLRTLLRPESRRKSSESLDCAQLSARQRDTPR